MSDARKRAEEDLGNVLYNIETGELRTAIEQVQEIRALLAEEPGAPTSSRCQCADPDHCAADEAPKAPRGEFAIIANLVAAIKKWGSEEDGVPDFAWKAYAAGAAYIVSPQAKPALPPEVREALTYCEEVFRSHSINTPNHEEIEDRALALIRAALAPRGGAE